MMILEDESCTLNAACSPITTKRAIKNRSSACIKGRFLTQMSYASACWGKMNACGSTLSVEIASETKALHLKCACIAKGNQS